MGEVCCAHSIVPGINLVTANFLVLCLYMAAQRPQDFIDADFLPDDVLEEGSLTILQLLELLVTRSHLVQYLIAQHVMICIYNLIMVYAFATTLGKYCTGAYSNSYAV